MILNSIKYYANIFRFFSFRKLLGLKNLLSFSSVLGDVDVVVSLTTHGGRLKNVWMTIESIGCGDSKPKKIILCIDPSLKDDLPGSLRRLQRRGLTILFRDDVGPHQKYYYALDIAVTENKPLVTVDDDCVYWSWWLKTIYSAHQENPDTIVCYRARQYLMESSEKFYSYNNWPLVEFSYVSPSVFFTGVSGVIYPVEFLRVLISYGTLFKSVCPKADDIWLNYLAAKTGTKARQIFSGSWDFPVVPNTQAHALWTGNSSGGNDAQLSATYDAATMYKLYSAINKACHVE